jgi:hypothetical protein
MPMAGHRRPNGTPICPSLPTPPQTPGLGSTPTPHEIKPYKSVTTLADVPYPPDGRYHYRNPNWNESAILDQPVAGPSRSGYDSDNESAVPTVLADHALPPSPGVPPHLMSGKMDAASPQRRNLLHRGHTPTYDYEGEYDGDEHHHRSREYEDEEEDDEEEGATPAPSAEDSISVRMLRAANSSYHVLGRILGGSSDVPDAGLYSTPRSQVSGLMRTANAMGYYAGVMRKPRPSPSGIRRRQREQQRSVSDRRRPLQAHESSVYLIVGREKEAVDHLADLDYEHRTGGAVASAVPGGFGLRPEQYNLGTPRGLLFWQVALAGAIGALCMAIMLAYCFD